MDKLAESLLSLNVVVIGLTCWAGTFLIRRIVETAVPSAKKQADANHPNKSYLTTFARWWNECVLYSIPPAIGMIVSMCYPQDLKTSGKLVLGALVGFFSSFVYKIVKKVISKKFDVNLGDSNSPPPIVGD
jgi:hypothetical protein